jgi:MFS family permease
MHSPTLESVVLCWLARRYPWRLSHGGWNLSSEHSQPGTHGQGLFREDAFTLFTPGLKQTFAAVPYAQIALIYTLFILFETWPVPLAGYLIDKFGIRNTYAR